MNQNQHVEGWHGNDDREQRRNFRIFAISFFVAFLFRRTLPKFFYCSSSKIQRGRGDASMSNDRSINTNVFSIWSCWGKRYLYHRRRYTADGIIANLVRLAHHHHRHYHLHLRGIWVRPLITVRKVKKEQKTEVFFFIVIVKRTSASYRSHKRKK
jgi:hypothetical protein